ncbi:MAG: CPBP family intramembrane metalloprotease [Actinobacteria bacterium]|nr:MAG: CPBP family intramembrane metalloprotease [Actinomycetota bacterium]
MSQGPHPQPELRTIVWRALGALALIQLALAAIFRGLLLVAHGTGSVFRFQLVNGASFLALGILLLIVFRPTLSALGLSLAGKPMHTWALSFLGVALVLTLVITSRSFGIMPFVLNLTFGLAVPAFEELLFRGWLFGKLRPISAGPRAAWVTISTGAVLFGLWHLGYAPTLLQHPAHPEIASLLAFKVGYGTVLGLATGWLRERTGGTYAPFVLHAVANIFAP